MCLKSRHSTLIRIHFAFGVLALSVCGARADNFVWSPLCDNVWQTCCGGPPTTFNNWNRTNIYPICPVLPSGVDNVTIVGDCIVGPVNSAVAGALDQSNGTFTLNGPLGIGTLAEFDGPVIWNAGDSSRSGAAAGQFARISGGLTIQGDADKSLSFLGGFRLINAGQATWSGNGNWTIGMIPGACCPSIFENPVGAAFAVRTDAPILSTAFGAGRIENAGTITKEITTGVSNWAVDLHNTGTVRVMNGELKLTQRGSSSGPFLVDAGATLAFEGLGYELLPGANISGEGLVIVRYTGAGNQLIINNALTIDRITLAPAAGVGGTGTLGINEQLTCDSGEIRLPTHILMDARLEALGVSIFRAPLDISGAGHIPGGASFIAAGQPVTIHLGGDLQIDDGATLGNDLDTGGSSYENHGTIRKTAGAGTGTISFSYNRILRNHADGVLAVEGGTLLNGVRLDNRGAIEIAADGIFKHSNWADYHPGTTFPGDGWFHLDNAANNLIDDGFTLIVPRLRISGSIFAGHGFGGSGNLSITHELDFQGGQIFTSMLTIQPGAVLTVSGPNPTISNGVNENHGTTRIIGADFSYFSGAFNNRPGGTIDLQSDFYFGGRFGNNPVNNEGTFIKSAGTGDSPIGGTINNSGVVRLQSGRMAPTAFVQSAGLTQVSGGGMRTNSMTLNGGTLTGDGTLHVNLVNTAGTIEPGASAGALNIASNAEPAVAGDFSQGVNGSLRIEIGGLTPDSGHDQLVVARNASLNGGLSIDLIGGFAPQLGDQFVILTAGGTRTGTFARVSGVQIGGGLQFTVQYNPNNVTLAVASGGTISGDIDGDGHVAIGDLTLLLSSFGLCDGQPGFNEGADLDGDGCVAIGDLTTLLAHFGM